MAGTRADRPRPPARDDAPPPGRPEDVGAVATGAVQAFLLASRALVAVAARSVDDVQSDLTLPQYRALVVLGSRGGLNVTVLADEVGVHQTTASRLVARLVSDGLVERETNADNRREVRLELTSAGRALLVRVRRRREDDIATILGRMPVQDREAATDALRAFAVAAGEQPEQHWPWVDELSPSTVG